MNPTTESTAPAKPNVAIKSLDRLALRINEVAECLGISRRAIEREKSAGRFPGPDRVIGRMPLWRVETIQTWLDGRKP